MRIALYNRKGRELAIALRHLLTTSSQNVRRGFHLFEPPVCLQVVALELARKDLGLIGTGGVQNGGFVGQMRLQAEQVLFECATGFD